jgi:hypothetical protein
LWSVIGLSFGGGGGTSTTWTVSDARTLVGASWLHIVQTPASFAASAKCPQSRRRGGGVLEERCGDAVFFGFGPAATAATAAFSQRRQRR